MADGHTGRQHQFENRCRGLSDLFHWTDRHELPIVGGERRLFLLQDEFDHLAFETPANAIFEDIIMQGIIARVIGDNEGKVSGLDKVRLSRLKAALHDCETLLAECEQVISVEV